MENQHKNIIYHVITLALLLTVLITGVNGTCSLLSITTQGPVCTVQGVEFQYCSSSVRSSIVVTSATVSVDSGISVDATNAANDIIQCSEKACTELAFFLLVYYSQQFCFTLDNSYGGTIIGLTAAITVSHSGGSQSFDVTFNGLSSNHYYNANNWFNCQTFTIDSLASGPTTTPDASSSLTQYTNAGCDVQALTTMQPTTMQATTQTTTPLATTPSETTPLETTEQTTTQVDTTSTSTSLSTSLSATASPDTTAGLGGHCGSFKIGDSFQNCRPKLCLCSNPDFNTTDVTVLSATLRMSAAPPVNITRLAQGIMTCSLSACEGALYEVIQMYSRVECISVANGSEPISIEIEYTYESFTYSLRADNLFTIHEAGLHSDHCDNLYYELRPNTTSNTLDYPFNCTLLNESKYNDSSSTDTSESTENKRGCPRMSTDFVGGISIGDESCGATFIILSDSLNISDAQVTFESKHQSKVVGGAINVKHNGIDYQGAVLNIISLVMIIDITDGVTTVDLDGYVIIDFAVNLTGPTNDVFCAFIANESSGVWSSDGMEVVSANSSFVQCRSNHLTSFAVLLSAKPPQGLNAVIQSHLSRVMGALSVLSLTLAIFIYFATGTWKQLKIKIHINLAVSTALGQLLFMTMAEMTWNRIICKTTAVTLQYLFTSALAWTMVEGVFLYRTTAVGFKPLQIGWLSLFAWGGSLVVVGISFGILYDGYGSTSYCWLRHDDYTIYVFVGCVFAVLLFNSMILFFVMKSFMALKANAKKDELDKIRAMTRAMLILLPILGLTWFAGAITSITKSDNVIFFQYLFIISFGLQGVCIFIFHCLQVPDVKAALKTRLRRRVQDSTWASKSGAPRSTATSSF